MAARAAGADRIRSALSAKPPTGQLRDVSPVFATFAVRRQRLHLLKDGVERHLEVTHRAAVDTI